jgi:RNA polymerase sigma-70 factor (ECF subfamily)
MRGSEDDTHKSAGAELEELISRCALGDRKAFDALYDATSAKLYAICVRILGTNAAAEDAMQDTYIKIWNNAAQYSVTGHSPMTWLITNARNTSIDRLRARREDSDLADHGDVSTGPRMTPEQSELSVSRAGRIKDCLSSLPDDRSDGIKAAYFDGYSYADLAERANVPLNTMRTSLRRGLTALWECMTQ